MFVKHYTMPPPSSPSSKVMANVTVDDLNYVYVWPLTLKDDLCLDRPPLKMCGFMRYTCMPNIIPLYWFKSYGKCFCQWFDQYLFYLCSWRITLTSHPSKYSALRDTHACQISALLQKLRPMLKFVTDMHTNNQTDREKKYAHQICIWGHTNLRTNWRKIHFCWILYESEQSASG